MNGEIDATAHVEFTGVLDWLQLRTLLSTAIGNVPASAADRWQRVADLVNAHCAGSRRQPADVFERVVGQLTRSNVPGAARLETDPSVGRDLWTRIFYRAMLDAPDEHPPFLNLGYVGSPEEATRATDENESCRPQVWLYDRVIGDTPLRDRRILEVGCGRGGGCGFIARAFSPRFVLGLDLVESHIAACRRSRRTDREHYIVGNATEFPLADSSFDVVVNIESSHNYKSFAGFVEEVHRVLGPEGVFLFGDVRPSRDAWDGAFRAFSHAGFSVRGCDDVSDGVLRAIESQAVPPHDRLGVSWTTAREAALSFRATVYERMKSGAARFMAMALAKA